MNAVPSQVPCWPSERTQWLFSREVKPRRVWGHRRRDEVPSNQGDTVKSCPVVLCTDAARSGVQVLGQIPIQMFSMKVFYRQSHRKDTKLYTH